mmetsp:Transcript_25262/g.66511  ORF Transcript_25262/g.66511 Transcript_25262/m.66511 type:complete len:241 (-) Transcript_25262:260-982(-)
MPRMRARPSRSATASGMRSLACGPLSVRCIRVSRSCSTCRLASGSTEWPARTQRAAADRPSTRVREQEHTRQRDRRPVAGSARQKAWLPVAVATAISTLAERASATSRATFCFSASLGASMPLNDERASVILSITSRTCSFRCSTDMFDLTSTVAAWIIATYCASGSPAVAPPGATSGAFASVTLGWAEGGCGAIIICPPICCDPYIAADMPICCCSTIAPGGAMPYPGGCPGAGLCAAM